MHNEDFQLALAIAHLGCWRIDDSSQEMEWSEELYGILGVDTSVKPKVELFWSLVHPDDLEKLRGVLAQANDGQPQKLEHRIIRVGGEERIAVSTVQSRLSGRQIVGTVLDVTDARLQTRLVSESEALFRASLNSLDVGVIFMNTSEQITVFNPRAGQILGLTDDQMKELTPHDVALKSIREDESELPPEEHPIVVALRSHQAVESYVHGFCRPDGELIWLDVNAVPVTLDDQAKPIGAVASFTDISQLRIQQRFLQQEMASTNEQAITLELQKMELEMTNERLEDLATLDGLTGLKNHRSFQEFLEKELVVAKRTGHALSLLLLDVDRFKAFNDEFGHPAGDQVLRGVADALSSAARKYDFVARYGGEEFVIVLVEANEQGAMIAAERFRREIEMREWPYRQVTASFGAASIGPDVESREALIALADAALYKSKDSGRNCCTHARDARKSA